MAPTNRLDAVRASTVSCPHYEPMSNDDLDFADLEAEMQRLTAANDELLHEFQSHDTELELPAETVDDELALLRLENAELKARLQELEAMTSGESEQLWRERQHEYEMLLEEKSEVIRGLHLKIQEMQESSIGGGDATPSGTKLAQAEEILRLKRELDDQRRQLETDEQDMMEQMRQMELTMAKERAEMARQRQEIQRLQAEIEREVENSTRAPELRERLQSLRRLPDARQTPPPPTVVRQPAAAVEQKSSGFLRRIFG